VDVTDGAARVELLVQRTQIDPNAAWANQRGSWQPAAAHGGLVTRPLCRTPCTINLPRGDHELLLTHADPSTDRSSTAPVRIGARPSVLRHTLGHQQMSVAGLIGGLLLGSFGVGIGLTGGALLGIGEDSTGSDLRPAGGILLGVGVAMGILGWLWGDASRPTIQPGSTTQWTP